MNLGNTDGGTVYSSGLQIDYDFGFATFTSLTGYRDHDFKYTEDFDGLPLILNNYSQDQDGDYFEQEFRLVSNGEGPLNWYAGVSYYKENISTDFSNEMSEDVWCSVYYTGSDSSCEDLFAHYKEYAYFLDYFGTVDWQGSPTGTMIDRNSAKGKYEGYAAYVDVGYDFNDEWDASVGLRYTKDEKDFSNYVLPTTSPVLGNRAYLGFSTPEGALSDSDSWDDLTPRVIVNYHPNDDVLLFGSVTAGYKTGGYNTFGLTPAAKFGSAEATPDTHKPASFDPETSVSYELGYKGIHNEGNTQLSANVFYYQYEDLQATYFEGSLLSDNVGKVDGWGLEGSIVQNLGDYFMLNAGLAWFDSEAGEVDKLCGGTQDCEGSAIPWAPEWSGHLALNGNLPLGNGELFGIAAYAFQDDHRGGWEPDSTTIDGYGELNLSLGYRGESWSVSAYVDNATDEQFSDGGGNGDEVYVAYEFGPSRPRTAGVKLGFNF